MARPVSRARTALLVVLAGAVLVACGERSIDTQLPDDASADIRRGAELFNDRCSGCHTLNASGSEGSAYNVRDRERVDGPSLNARPQEVDAVLYAIRNGGFSGAIMPENIVTGEEAELVAEFVAEYAGNAAERPLTPNSETANQSGETSQGGGAAPQGGSTTPTP
jgi:mono/diheme cytochrome c family protein